tara:strand:+ start:29360 stop:29680 length:321 start_codon:yes stop_codon:yes gene_type:complete
MLEFDTFIDDTKNYTLAYVASLVFLVCSHSLQGVLNKTSGKLLFAASIIVFIGLTASFTTKLVSFVSENAAKLPSSTLILPNLTCACVLSFASISLVLYSSYVLLD